MHDESKDKVIREGAGEDFGVVFETVEDRVN